MKVIPGMCRTKLDICLYWLSSIYTMDKPDEGLFQGCVVTKLDIYVFIDFPVFIPWAHQMKVISRDVSC